MLRGTDRAVRKRSRRRGPGATSPRGDEGVTLVELLVAIVVILIILIPTAVFIIQAQKAVSVEHLQAEAINVATRQLESLQLEAAQGSLPTGTSTVTYPVAEAGSRITDFKVTTSWTVITQGTNQSICTSDADVAQQIWLVTAVVTWPKMSGASPVVQTTEIAPAQAGAVQQFAGEVAVRLTYDGTNPFLSAPVTATITAHWQGSGADPVAPSGTFKTVTASTASTSSSVSDGCIVFQDVDAYSDADGSYSYTISFAGNTGPPPLVAGGEQADSNPGGALTVTVATGQLAPGVPYPISVTMNTGTPLTVGYYNGTGSCTTAPGSALSPPLPSNGVPLSVGNSFLAPINPAVFFGSAPISSLLLFPWSGVTSVWTGDQAYSASAGSCPVNATGGSPSVYLPVYPLNIKVNGSASTLTAKEVAGGGYAMTLNYNSASGKWATSMPLGEYGLYHDGSTTLNVSPNYVWVTAAGVCTDTSIEVPTPPSLVPSPPSGCSAASVTVTAS